ncbi:hypothetical protein BBW65_04785 [Helicobacter enhydrae]|uniref:Uncharacterized protein n=1 Tax=Helicobacter enhydrae TaxID=222136 RepID=A0A1B1U5U0_9HELI|nr:hypothetical protein BBW65_04785 [Helicobacter enhydrae]
MQYFCFIVFDGFIVFGLNLDSRFLESLREVLFLILRFFLQFFKNHKNTKTSLSYKGNANR